MSEPRKTQLKKIGAVALGTLAISGLAALVGAILYYLNAKADNTNVRVESLSADISAIKQDTSWIKTYLCSRQSGNCSIPQ